MRIILPGKSLPAIMILSLVILYACQQSGGGAGADAKNLFQYDDNLHARWSSPENLNGIKGAGGKENNGAKGHPFDSIPAGATLTLLDIKEQGIIQRIWVTVRDRSPEMLRAMKLEMYWDGEEKPAVSVPFGDFFGVGLGKTAIFQNHLFANAEGRSFNCFIPMPFRKGARITVTNESTKSQPNIFFDVDYSLLKNWRDDYLYFHAFFTRDTATTPSVDFVMLPRVEGKGRFLGVNIGVNANPLYKKSWFGEGEVKIYLDGDTNYPTLNGTGTEDYIGTAWGQGKFINDYTGCTISDDSLLQWAFYRYHIPDPIYFSTDCRVTIQTMGGDMTNVVAGYQSAGVPLLPVTTDAPDGFHRFYKKDSLVVLDSTRKDSWTNFYRSDDYSSTAYFYLDRPSNELPPLQKLTLRTTGSR